MQAEPRPCSPRDREGFAESVELGDGYREMSDGGEPSRPASGREAPEPKRKPASAGDAKPGHSQPSRTGDPFRDTVLVCVCLISLLFATLSVSVVLVSALLGRVPLIEPDVRLLNWDPIWKKEIGGIQIGVDSSTDLAVDREFVEGAAAGWEKLRKYGRDVNVESLGNAPFEGPPKIAFMFLVRDAMPLVPLWERFLQNNTHRASIYVHASCEGYNISEQLSQDSVFYNRQIPGVSVKWGGLGMVRAERELLAAALEDPANQRFIFFSESCIPVRSFSYVSDYVFSTNKSFITSHHTDWRYPGRKMQIMIPPSKFRKGSQWIALNRKHAELVSMDHKYLASFAETSAWIPDESYIQTLVPLLDPDFVEPRSVSFVEWPSILARHPTTFQMDRVKAELIKEIQARETPTEETVDWTWRMSRSDPCQLNGKQAPCFLFARKFPPQTVPALLDLGEHLGY